MVVLGLVPKKDLMVMLVLVPKQENSELLFGCLHHFSHFYRMDARLPLQQVCPAGVWLRV